MLLARLRATPTSLPLLFAAPTRTSCYELAWFTAARQAAQGRWDHHQWRDGAAAAGVTGVVLARRVRASWGGSEPDRS
jgi:hypothetical protein